MITGRESTTSKTTRKPITDRHAKLQAELAPLAGKLLEAVITAEKELEPSLNDAIDLLRDAIART